MLIIMNVKKETNTTEAAAADKKIEKYAQTAG